MNTSPLSGSVTIDTRSPEQTFQLGRSLGQRLNKGLVIFLYGELGSGKTAFAQGLANGLDIPSDCPVTSPTYTLINSYAGRLAFHHVDLYRLPEPVDPDEIGLYDLFDGSGIVAIEWPGRLHPTDHPHQRLDLHFSVTGDNARRIDLFAYGLDVMDLLKEIGV